MQFPCGLLLIIGERLAPGTVHTQKSLGIAT